MTTIKQQLNQINEFAQQIVKNVNDYQVGYYTPQGRMTITITADSREEARTKAYSMGFQVIDVSLD